MYSSQLLEHFQHPHNAGDLPGADAQVRVENPACGDILELAAKSEGGRIVEIRFKAKGCVPAMACASALTELAMGKSIEEANAITRSDIALVVGGLPSISGHAAQLGVDALQGVLRRLTELSKSSSFHSDRSPRAR